jgi:hypothetical protein
MQGVGGFNVGVRATCLEVCKTSEAELMKEIRKKIEMFIYFTGLYTSL